MKLEQFTTYLKQRYPQYRFDVTPGTVDLRSHAPKVKKSYDDEFDLGVINFEVRLTGFMKRHEPWYRVITRFLKERFSHAHVPTAQDSRTSDRT